MANTSSAKKAHEASLRKRVFNMRRARKMKAEIKQVADLISAKQKKEVQELLPSAYQALDKAVKRGIIKPNMAARKKARITKAINDL
jgi:small subunit ribosomal protein S20